MCVNFFLLPFPNLKILNREIGHPFLKFAKNFTIVSYIPVSYKSILRVLEQVLIGICNKATHLGQLVALLYVLGTLLFYQIEP